MKIESGQSIKGVCPAVEQTELGRFTSVRSEESRKSVWGHDAMKIVGNFELLFVF